MSRFITNPAIVMKITSFVRRIGVELNKFHAHAFIHK